METERPAEPATPRLRAKVGLGSLPVRPGTQPMEAKLVEELPKEEGWQFEPKWDGFRCLAYRAGPDVELQSKSGKSLARYFPDVVAALQTLPLDRFVLDGELAILSGDALSFDALQNRLHPAESRVRKLATEAPAMFIVFDCLATAEDGSLMEAPLTRRRMALERFFASLGDQLTLRLTPYTRDAATARGWLKKARGSLDGVVAKRLDGRYVPGEREMLKVKLLRTADCVVGGFRYAADSNLVGSLLLGLYDDAGKLHHVGFTSTIKDEERKALTKRLEKMIEPPGFTGEAPGAPSRWSNERSAEWKPLKPQLVVEVKYDQVTGNRFRHGTRLLRWRPDKKPDQCTCDQLQREAPPAKLVAEVIGR
ncbi:ATP-dependent DNA ligase [Dongia deserti]|uniref:ATP-dependent DNA ligase n=1 Tax=Dongia deserti TaxID=2268030 RepID=UPI002547B17B|nr:ATP-dependent DNA ligase [Dongia deserti]